MKEFNYELSSFAEMIKENSYGGNQNWFSENINRNLFNKLIDIMIINEGCGYVSIVNMYLYSKYKENKIGYNKTEFMEYVEIIYKKNLNFRIGINSINFLEKIGKKFITNLESDKYYFIKFQKHGNSKIEAINFIIENIKNDYPIAMLIHHEVSDNQNNNSFKYHWITITGIHSKNDKIYLMVSTWGEKWSYIDFDDVWDKKNKLINLLGESGMVVLKY